MIWWILLAALMFSGGTYVEKSNRPAVARLRGSRGYQGTRTRVINTGMALRGKPAVYLHGKRVRGDDAVKAAATTVQAPRTPSMQRKAAPPLAYAAPAPAAAAAASSPSARSNGVTVDFFEAILHVANAPYEGPNDALRQLRILTEGGRTWDQGLIRLHQRMSDAGDMRIDPFVYEHVLQAATFAKAMVLQLTEADTALTALLNMTIGEITERGLQVPNTR